MYIKKCDICGKEFVVNRYNTNVCSNECRIINRNKKLKIRREKKRIYYVKYCKKCGKEFVTYWSRKIFCSNSCKCGYWDKLRADKKPRKTNKRYSIANELRTQSFTPKQLSIILGTLLGNGCLIKSSKTGESNLYRLSWTHGAVQKEYIEWKNQEMKPFTTNGLIRYKRKNNNGFGRKDNKEEITYHLVTIGHNDLARLRGILYRGKKKFVTRRYLNMLDELSLAVWYMDDGSYSKKNKAMILHTLGMNMSEHKAMQKWFWQRWHIECIISNIKKEYNNGIKRYNYLRFRVSETKKFHNLVAPYIIPSMQYKLNPQRLIR